MASYRNSDGLAPSRKRLHFRAFADKNSFLFGMILVVSLARAFPTLGANGSFLRPELVIAQFGVSFIFLLMGLSMEVSQVSQALSNIKLISLIQFCTFGVWPFLVGIPLTKACTWLLPNALPKPLLDGLLILSCLPTTVNMCVILTSAAGGNVASSVCNAVLSNLMGIVVTPALLFHFFGSSIQLPFLEMCLKLCGKILVPVALGQLLRSTIAGEFSQKYSGFFKRSQEFALLSILWNSFCTAFVQGFGIEIRHSLTLLALLPTLHVASLATLFKIFSIPAIGLSRSDVIAGMFVASHKTLAFGLPLISTVFAGDVNLAAYSAPIMLLFPLQLIIGSLLVPQLEIYTAKL